MADGEERDRRDAVGPVLVAGATAAAVIAAIREENADVEVVDRGTYLRVLVPRRCRVSRAAIERQLAADFEIPADLEKIMPSFKGKLRLYEGEAVWEVTVFPASR